MTRAPIDDWAAARSHKWRRQLTGLEAMLAPIDAALIEALALTAPARIADVGCGAGATTIEVSRVARAGSVVHGFDLSPALIDVARSRQCPREVPVSFDVADMESAAPPAQPYDRLVSRLGVMFFRNPLGAFSNLRQWVARDGRIAFAVWGPLEDNVWMTATRAAVAEVVDLAPVDLTAPGPFRYGHVAPLVSALETAGFSDVRVTDWQRLLPMGRELPAADAAEFALASFSSFAEVLSSAGGNAMQAARQSLAARFSTWERAGRVQLPGRIHIVTARALEPEGAWL